MRKPAFILFLLILTSVLSSCSLLREKTAAPSYPPLCAVDDNEIPDFYDDLEMQALEAAVLSSLSYYNRVPAAAKFSAGNIAWTAEELRESLHLFLRVLKDASTQVKRDVIINNFDVFRAAGYDGAGSVLFTGYYEPILDGSLKQTEKYKYPLYRTPEDLVTFDDPACSSRRSNCQKQIGRRWQGRAVSYFTRADIDSAGILNGRNLELVWLADPVDRFYLHIQGSGKIRLPDGGLMRVGYAQSNGLHYRSIADYLFLKDRISASQRTHQCIKAYLRNHPEELSEIFNYNERYIFFREVTAGPVGALGTIVEGGRSIATDPSIFPKGALAFIKIGKKSERSAVSMLRPSSRFVLNQDEGSAIKGPGRVDVFCGSGGDAEVLAGSLKDTGSLYFLLPKRKASKEIRTPQVGQRLTRSAH